MSNKMATQAMNLDLIPVDEINSPNEASIKNDIPMVVSDDEEVAGDGGIYDESALDDCSSVLESDSEWGADDGDHNDGGVVKDDGEDVQDKKESALSAANLEDWLFSSSSPKAEDVVSEDDVDMDFDDADNGELDNQNGVEASPDDEIPVNSNAATSDKLNESVEDALSLIKTIDAEKVKQQQSQSQLQDMPSDKDKGFFEPGVPQLAAAERKMHETRTSKELELEALRNRGLAGRNSRQLKKTINKNLQIQIDDAHRNGNMEWRKIGGGDDSQDEIEIGTMTTGTATSPQLAQQATSPAVVTSPTMAYEQLAMEQQKERDRAKKLEQETMIQNQLHPESQRKAEQKLLEMDFVFGLLVGKNDPPPEIKAATKAAAKIVPNMLTSKKTIYYDPRYPPKVAFIELDEAYDAKVAAQKATEALGPKAKGKVIALQKRYMVRGRVPVLPRKRSNKSRSSDPKSPNGGMTANATISTQPLTPLTATGSASNSVCSGGDPATMKETLAMPTMEQVASPVAAEDVTTSANINKKEDTVADADDGLQPTMSEEAEMAGVLEGPMNTSADELMVDNMSERGGPSEEFVVAAKEVASPKSPKPNLVVNTRSSSTDIRSIRMSKDAELEAIRQRRVAKEKNLGFAQLEAQSASSKAAYEAEQQDLLQRKSGASEFQFSAGRIVNPLDQLYLQQNKQNRSYREIQQKTREEYHRVSPSAAAAAAGEGQ
ncbi:unnamed protein product [Cylindrotheca closterium]|uniref:Uncharacterized protein n=1 Tax=Cylindrotheca closterium TaxID=2856 RepID=A0AAD2JNZ4_9STRA|nr:unnamed protein product [Cylindrotheca closterium]